MSMNKTQCQKCAKTLANFIHYNSKTINLAVKIKQKSNSNFLPLSKNKKDSIKQALNKCENMCQNTQKFLCAYKKTAQKTSQWKLQSNQTKLFMHYSRINSTICRRIKRIISCLEDVNYMKTMKMMKEQCIRHRTTLNKNENIKNAHQFELTTALELTSDCLKEIIFCMNEALRLQKNSNKILNMKMPENNDMSDTMLFLMNDGSENLEIMSSINDAMSLYQKININAHNIPFENDDMSQRFMKIIFRDLIRIHSEHLTIIRCIYSCKFKGFYELYFVCAKHFNTAGSALENINKIIEQYIFCNKSMKQIFDGSLMYMYNSCGRCIAQLLQYNDHVSAVALRRTSYKTKKIIFGKMQNHNTLIHQNVLEKLMNCYSRIIEFINNNLI